MIILMYLSIGAFAGLSSGLLGIGGGTIVVPALFFVFHHWVHSVPEVLSMHLAIGTSLAMMVFTTFSAALAHYRQKTMCWHIVRAWFPGLVLGSMLGVIGARYLPVIYLRTSLAIFLLLIAIKLLVNFQVKSSNKSFSNRVWLALGSGIGVLSGLFGIGGGVIIVPLLNHLRCTLIESIGTAAVSAFPVAVCGSIASIWVGWTLTQQVPHSLGFVYLPAFIAIIPSAIVMAYVGARLGRYIPATWLRKCFALLLAYISVEMLF